MLRERWIIALLLLVAWWGGRGLQADPLWYDEYRSYYYAGVANYGPIPFAETWTRTADNLINIPGFFYVVRLWSAFTGHSEFAGRYLALLFGVLAVAVTYRLGADTHGPKVGRAAAVMLASSALFGFYLHELRTYTLLTLLCALNLWLYWRALRGHTGRWASLAIVLTTAALLYLHYAAALFLAGVGLYHLLFADKGRHWWHITGLFVLGGLLFIPWMLEVLAALAVEGSLNEAIREVTQPAHITVAAMLNGFSNQNLLLVLVLLAFGARSRLLWTVFIVTVVLLLSMDVYTGTLHRLRYWLPLWPILAVMAGAGLVALSARLRVHYTVPLVLWAGAGLWWGLTGTVDAEQRPAQWILPHDDFAATLQPLAHDDDLAVMLLPNEMPHWSHDGVADYYLTVLAGEHEVVETRADWSPARFREQMQTLFAGRERVFLGMDPAQRPTNAVFVAEILRDAGYLYCDALVDSRELVVEVYARPAETPAVMFENGVALSLLPQASAADETLTAVIGWQVPDDVPPFTYSVALHADAPDGSLAAQADFPLPNAGEACTITTLTVPPGDFDLRVIVYAWETGERVYAEGDEERPSLTAIRMP